MNNPFSLEDVIATEDYKQGLPSTRRYDTVDLGKPGAEDWFRGYDLGKGFDQFAISWITKKKDAEGKQHPYLITGKPDFKAAAVQKLKRVQRVHLYYGITSHYRPFIWPVAVVDDIKEALGWHVTGLEIAKAGMTRWTQIQSDKPNNRYIHLDLENQKSVPDYDVYKKPPIDYVTAINKAFKDRFISNEDHPIYKAAGTIVESSYVNSIKKGVIKP
jgi:hypothetical protein